MKLQFIQPKPELKPYIHQFWLLESDFAIATDKSLIAPNARPKIMIPFKNSLLTTHNGKTTVCREHDIYFIGIRDVPVTIGSGNGATGSIGIELTTAGAYRFLKTPMSAFTNNLFSFSDVFGKRGYELQQRMMNTEAPDKKADLIQSFLFGCLTHENRANLLVDHSVNMISSSFGMMEIKELVKRTGYSKRYLDMLFQNHLGISPKTFSTILRFQRFYKDMSHPGFCKPIKAQALESYYDQAHFIKEFKRYTGHTPLQFTKLRNDFGKNF